MTDTTPTFYRERTEHGDITTLAEAGGFHLQSDFARGQRANPNPVWLTGDFATGMRTMAAANVVGDFATGMRTLPASEVIGTFATTGAHTVPAPRTPFVLGRRFAGDQESLPIAAFAA